MLVSGVGRVRLVAAGFWVLAILARLGDREGGPPPSLAADAAVGAVADEGRRTGRVGDFGRGLVRGDVGPGLLFATELVLIVL